MKPGQSHWHSTGVGFIENGTLNNEEWMRGTHENGGTIPTIPGENGI